MDTVILKGNREGIFFLSKSNLKDSIKKFFLFRHSMKSM